MVRHFVLPVLALSFILPGWPLMIKNLRLFPLLELSRRAERTVGF